jgi:hypothetical protein
MKWKRKKGEKLRGKICPCFPDAPGAMTNPRKGWLPIDPSVDHRILQTGKEKSAGVKYAYV